MCKNIGMESHVKVLKNKSQSSLKFQRRYHKFFPDEALAAIQKTTAAQGLSNKAKQLGLTVADIASGKDVDKERIDIMLENNFYELTDKQLEVWIAKARTKAKKS